MEASVKLARALEIAGKARIRRRIAAPEDNTERVASPSERPVALRDARGRYLKGWAGGSGRAPRDALRELYVDELVGGGHQPRDLVSATARGPSG
jgi:hypothetical protein